MGSFVCDLSLGNSELWSFAWEAFAWSLSLGSVVWHASVVFRRLAPFASDLSRGKFRLEACARHITPSDASLRGKRFGWSEQGIFSWTLSFRSFVYGSADLRLGVLNS